MATLSRAKTWAAGETLTASDLNAEYDNIHSTINGNLNDANLGVTAGLAAASKALVLDASRDLDDTNTANQIRHLTISGNAAVGGNLTVTGTSTFNGGTITLGDAAGDTVTIGGTIQGNLIFEGSTANAYELTLAPADVTADRTLTMPDATDTLVGRATTDTLTNKTITSATLNTPTITGNTTFSDGSYNFNIASHDGTNGLALAGTVVTSSAAELNFVDGVTAGTVAASKAVVVDSNKDIGSFRNLTLTGELDAATGDFSGDVDVDGTLEADAITLGGTALGSLYSPIAGSTSITTVGTIGTGTWQGTVIASAYLDSDTAHLTGTQTFTGAKTFTNTVTVGANDAGHDVILYGDTASANMTWDTSADDLILNGSAGLIVPDGQLTLGSTAVSSTASEINLLDALSRGSILYGNASGATAILTKGGAGTVLTSDGTDISWAAAAATGGHTIQEEGSSLTQRTKLNFIGAGVTATDDSGNDATKITVTPTGASLPVTRSDGSTSDPIALTSAALGESLVSDTSPQLGGNLDVNGQSIVSASNGNIQITPNGTGSVLVGVDDTGHDVKFFGATSGKYMEWDESADKLKVSGTMGLGTAISDASQGVGLHICTADADPDATVNASNDELIIEGNTSVGISLLTDDDGVARITWGHGSGTDAYSGQIGYYQGSDYMNFLTASTERLRIGSDGRVDIGTAGATVSSSADKLVVNDGANAGMTIYSTGTSSGQMKLSLTNANGADDGAALIYSNSANKFFINSNGAVERFSIDANGFTTITNSTSSTPYGLYLYGSGGNPNNTTVFFLKCESSTETKAFIYSNGDFDSRSNSYSGISDVKNKQNITDARNYWDDFAQVKFRKFKFKNDVAEYGDNAPSMLGVVAQEIETIFPNLVSESPDTQRQEVPILDAEGNDTGETEEKDVDLGTTTKSVKYSILSQIGLKVIQELQVRLEAAETKIAALEAA